MHRVKQSLVIVQIVSRMQVCKWNSSCCKSKESQPATSLKMEDFLHQINVLVAHSCKSLGNPLAVACGQAPPSMEFSRQEQWSGQPFPSPGDFPDQGIKATLLHCRQILYRLTHQGILLHQISSVAQLCLTLCDPIYCSTPRFPVHHQLPELAQTHVQVSGAIQPSHPLLSPSLLQIQPYKSFVFMFRALLILNCVILEFIIMSFEKC